MTQVSQVHIIGKENISAKIIADSVGAQSPRFVTFELEFPRYILSELNTHRMLSKNTASSRAIPIKTMIEHIKQTPAMPVHWGKNQPGMKAREELDGIAKEQAIAVWNAAREDAIAHATVLNDIQVHKQIANRRLEADMLVKTVMSGTELSNLLYLRDHPDAQPEFAELAKCIRIALEQSVPTLLYPGEWHLPYVRSERQLGVMTYFDVSGEEISLETARKISASCCAQVSYRRNDESVEKAIKIFDMLNINSGTGEPPHYSPVEHQATPMEQTNLRARPEYWELGVSHVDRYDEAWSGNLRGWIQYRKLLEMEG